MKKLFAIIVCAILMISVACAEDYSKMSTEELQTALDAIRNELLTRDPAFGENYILYDDGEIQLYFTGTYSARDHSFDKDVVVVEFDAILVNKSQNNVRLVIGDCYVNGWSASASEELGSLKAGKKAKGTIRINTSAVTSKGISKELEEIELEFVIRNADTKKNITDVTVKTIQFPLK